MATKKQRALDTIRAQKGDIAGTLAEYQARAGEIQYRRADLSATGKADALAALRAQYKANLESDAKNAWTLATAARDAAQADYRAAALAHAATGDPARLTWRAREYSARLAAARYAPSVSAAFDPIAWLGAERDRLAAVGDTEGMRALRVVAREALATSDEPISAARLASVLERDEESERADVLAAERDARDAARAVDDLRKYILDAHVALEPSAAHPLRGSDPFTERVFGIDTTAPHVGAPAVA